MTIVVCVFNYEKDEKANEGCIRHRVTLKKRYGLLITQQSKSNKE